MTTTVLIGLGRAGAELHRTALREMAAPLRPGRIVGVDPSVPTADFPDVAAAWNTLPEPQQAVWHVATPPDTHEAVVAELFALGALHIIVEKPFASSVASARALVEHAGRAKLIPVAVWPHSRVVQALRSFWGDRLPPGTEVVIEQSKPRQRRSRSDAGHTDALQIEVPHQVLLALHLAGPVEEIEEARVWDAVVDGVTLAGLGGARIDLRHADGRRTRIVSDLCSPHRERRVEARTPSGAAVAHLPRSADDTGGALHLPGRSPQVLRDRPLTAFLSDAYAAFAGRKETPMVPLPYHVHVVQVLEEAAKRAYAGRPS